MSGFRLRSHSPSPKFRSSGSDIDKIRIGELKAGQDRTREIAPADLAQPTLTYSGDSAALGDADFYIVTVPTPIDSERMPDLSAILAASQTVGRVLKRGDIVVYESTVYPGAVEEDCAPVLEKASRSQSRHRLYAWLFTGAHQSWRQNASF